jgi:hypothetical protein
VFIADQVILFPFKSILSIFQEIYNAAIQEMASESDAIRAELSQLYLALEAGSLTEETFDARESELLDRLDEIEARGLLEGDSDDDDEDEEEDDEAEDESDEPSALMSADVDETTD